VSGVTEGAINAYILSLYDAAQPEEQEKAVNHLKSFWETIGDSKVIDEYMFGPLQGLLVEDGLFMPNSLYQILDTEFVNDKYSASEKNSKRALNIGIANLHNGTFVSFNDNFKT
jgi:predicted acylesterase/phospholipase RssA